LRVRHQCSLLTGSGLGGRTADQRGTMPRVPRIFTLSPPWLSMGIDEALRVAKNAVPQTSDRHAKDRPSGVFAFSSEI